MKISEARAVLEGIIYGPHWGEATKEEARGIDGHFKEWMERGGDADILPGIDYEDVDGTFALWQKHIERAEYLAF